MGTPGIPEIARNGISGRLGPIFPGTLIKGDIITVFYSNLPTNDTRSVDIGIAYMDANTKHKNQVPR